MALKFEQPAIIFCATQRSGSTMIVDDLQNCTGRPRSETEAFYRLVISGQKPAGFHWADAMQIMQSHRSDEPVFFDKVMFHYLHHLSKLIDPKKHNPMCTPFVEFFEGATWVFIRRADIFAQAISKYFAEELNVWDAKDAKTADFNANTAFKAEKAMLHLRSLIREDRQWQRFFAHHRISPIELYYEDAVSNFPGYLQPVLQAAGIAATPDLQPIRRMQKLGNARSQTLADVLKNLALRNLLHMSFDMRELYRDNFI
ncbi:MAG: Stf0 family sulfotransferase [Gemmobacter sp.]|nr:Stf0 family sulfotransferase [Gemmobacter sp.]